MGAYENTTVGMQELTQTGITVFPNPARNEISIINSNRVIEIKLSDAEGRLIRNVKVNPFGITKIDISRIHQGCYFITSDDIMFRKLVKL